MKTMKVYLNILNIMPIFVGKIQNYRHSNYPVTNILISVIFLRKFFKCLNEGLEGPEAPLKKRRKKNEEKAH